MKKIFKDYISKIRSGLKGWTAESIDEAVSYYEEFIEDAVEQGILEQEILDRLGSPREIIDTIKTESNIGRTEKKPGPLGLMKSILGVPALKVSIFLGGLFPIVTAFLLYILSVALYIAIAGGVFISVYGILQIQPQYVWGIIGMAGLGLLSAGIFGALGYLIWQFANLITVHTMKLLRRYLRRNKDRRIKEQALDIDTGKMATGKKRRIRTVLISFAVICLIGVVMLIPSGLPARYFSIWNSAMPSSFTVKRGEFKPDEIKAISIKTLNSQVVLKKTISNVIIVSYQEPDWMEGRIDQNGANIVFTETSNGRLPYMQFVSRHEGMTEVTVMLPKTYTAESISIKTNGGTVKIEGLSDMYDISAEAGKDKIILNNRVLSDTLFQNKGRGMGVIRIEDRNGMVKID